MIFLRTEGKKSLPPACLCTLCCLRGCPTKVAQLLQQMSEQDIKGLGLGLAPFETFVWVLQIPVEVAVKGSVGPESGSQ